MVESVRELFRRQKATSLRLRSTGFEERVEYLRQLKRSLIKFEDELCEAVFLDFAKPYAETQLTEIYVIKTELHTALHNLRSWMQPRRVSSPVMLGWGKSTILCEPRGCALIVAPWNYPVQLALTPLIAAVAAGCTAILKPSEMVPNTSRVLKKMFDETFASDHVAVVEGGVEISQILMRLPFDHIFFTGSTEVGKLYMRAAAENLSSVTLELGGKSPVIVDESADIERASQKIIWGKLINAGQTCIAPDYLFVSKKIWPELRAALVEQINRLYPASRGWRDLAQIINEKHFQRLSGLIDSIRNQGDEIIFGGNCDTVGRKIEPLLFCPKTTDSPVMKEEIFGPILPILIYEELSEALNFINSREKPLALYIFANSNQVIENILQNTSSGGVCINDTLVHIGNHELPFGGVNHSGLGSYHGVFGFRAFSHERSVYKQTFLGRIANLIYPPYSLAKEKRIKLLTRLGR